MEISNALNNQEVAGHQDSLDGIIGNQPTRSVENQMRNVVIESWQPDHECEIYNEHSILESKKNQS